MSTNALILAQPNSHALAVRDPWALVSVGPLGNLDAYISATHQIPMLTEEEEQDLARRLQENNDIEAARRLVLSHLRLVVAVARQYLGYGLPHADLIQEGNIGLMKAVKRFDPEKGRGRPEGLPPSRADRSLRFQRGGARAGPHKRCGVLACNSRGKDRLPGRLPPHPGDCRKTSATSSPPPSSRC